MIKKNRKKKSSKMQHFKKSSNSKEIENILKFQTFKLKLNI